MNTATLRQKLSAPAHQLLSRLPFMGKVMIVVRAGGVTHERIGVVEHVKRDNDTIICGGASHDCAIDLRGVSALIVDRSGKMKDKVLPKLEFLDTKGDMLLSVVGLDGLERFDEGVSRFDGETLDLTEAQPSEQAVLSPNDPGLQPLAAASKSGIEVTIEMQQPGRSQRWSGVVPKVNPAMGFINVIASDFHLHVRGGTIASWETADADNRGQIRLTALDQMGSPTGLILQGPKDAFAN